MVNRRLRRRRIANLPILLGTNRPLDCISVACLLLLLRREWDKSPYNRPSLRSDNSTHQKKVRTCPWLIASFVDDG